MEIDSDLAPDLITALGYLCLGSRLKRLGERLQGGVAAHLAAQGHLVQPAQLPLLMALHVDGPMTIGALGERVGISQPGVSRAIAALEPLGMVAVAADGRDRRERRISLTPAGSEQMQAFERTLFPAVDRAVGHLCAAVADDLLGELGRIEALLAREPLDVRILRQMGEGDHG